LSYEGNECIVPRFLKIVEADYGVCCP